MSPPSTTAGTGSSVRGFLLGAIGSYGVGVLVGLMMQIGRPRIELLSMLLSGGVGMAIFLFAEGQLRVTGRWRRKLDRGAHAVVLTVIFAISGAAAWWTVFGLALLATGSSLSGNAVLFQLAVTGGIAVAVGFVFYTYDRLRTELSEKITRLKAAEFAERELELARAVQRRLLPPLKIDAGSYRLAARNRPALWVAGDFYDVFALPDGRQAIAVGDVAGKGMATSLIMASVKAMLPLVVTGGPGETLTALNQRLLTDLAGREFVAVALAFYRPTTGELELANAGLPDPYLIAADGAPRPLEVSGQRLPLGVRQDGVYGSIDARLEPGERLLLLTDGLPEADTGSGEPLGYEAFEALLARQSGEPGAFLGRLFQRLGVETGDVASDDWTAVLLERSS